MMINVLYALKSNCLLFVIIGFLSSADFAPVIDELKFNFEDDWDFQTKPHSYPMLNGSLHHFLLPLYTYSKDLKVEGLKSNETKVQNTTATRNSKVLGDIVRSKVSCGVCKLGVGLLHKEVKVGTIFEDIKAKFVSLCVTFKIETFDVCGGVFDTYGPEVVPVLRAAPIGPSEICSLLFGETCGNIAVPSHEWTVEFTDVPKPIPHTPDLPKPGLPVFKVLHISDTHYDPEYEEGSVSNCEEPLCCRSYSTPRTEEIIPAGRWGSYEKCDAPRRLLEHMFQHIALEHPDIDYIIWTGDLPPHDIWNQTKQNNLDIIKDTVEMVSNIFPDTPIFPAIGNHESSPSGNFAPHWMKDKSHSPDWLYEEIAEQWKRWLPASTGNTVLHGAFYSVLLRPGFRLISVNTNYCHSLSWWLALNSTDPASELQWLIHELQEAENKDEKVHIIGHIAPGSSDCLKTWSTNFYDIVDRYESSIVGLFYGHSHADEFEVFYDISEYSRPTGVAYLGPSVTSYQDFNPAYRIYYIDGDHANTTREIIDHETWTTDLEKANIEQNEPTWFKLYSAKEAFQMDSLRPSEWNKLIDQMVIDDDLFDRFYRYYYRDSSKRPVCDAKCKMQTLCDLKTGKSQSRHQLCHELELAFGI